jgi:hypothetical protein
MSARSKFGPLLIEAEPPFLVLLYLKPFGFAQP